MCRVEFLKSVLSRRLSSIPFALFARSHCKHSYRLFHTALPSSIYSHKSALIALNLASRLPSSFAYIVSFRVFPSLYPLPMKLLFIAVKVHCGINK